MKLIVIIINLATILLGLVSCSESSDVHSGEDYTPEEVAVVSNIRDRALSVGMAIGFDEESLSYNMDTAKIVEALRNGYSTEDIFDETEYRQLLSEWKQQLDEAEAASKARQVPQHMVDALNNAKSQKEADRAAAAIKKLYPHAIADGSQD